MAMYRVVQFSFILYSLCKSIVWVGSICIYNLCWMECYSELKSAWEFYRFFVVFILYSKSRKTDYITQYFNGVLILNINLGWNMQWHQTKQSEGRVGRFNGFAIKWFSFCFWHSTFQEDELILLEFSEGKSSEKSN